MNGLTEAEEDDMKIYEAWDELKEELEIFIIKGNGELQPGTDSDSSTSAAHDDMAAEVLAFMEELELKHE